MKPWTSTTHTTADGCHLSTGQATDTTAACQYQGQLTGENFYNFEPIVMLHKRQDQIVQRRIRRMVRQPVKRDPEAIGELPVSTLITTRLGSASGATGIGQFIQWTTTINEGRQT